MHFDYTPRGVCSRAIHIDLSDDGTTIEQVSFEGGCNGNLKAVSKLVSFEGGCNGNLKAVSKLVAGHPVDEIVGILAGNTCGPRPTSCADQLSRALTEAAASACA